MNKEVKINEGFCNLRQNDKLDTIGWAAGQGLQERPPGA